MLPLALTLLRVILSPIFILIYLYGSAWGLRPAQTISVLLLIMISSEISDVLDGAFARKKGQVTDLGKILDPMADSIFRLTVFFTFTQPPIQLPIVLVCLFFYRDSFIGTLRTLCALSGKALSARSSGKAKAIIQGVAAFGIMLLWILQIQGQISEAQLQDWSLYITGITALYTLFSGLEYLYSSRKIIREYLFRYV